MHIYSFASNRSKRQKQAQASRISTEALVYRTDRTTFHRTDKRNILPRSQKKQSHRTATEVTANRLTPEKLSNKATREKLAKSDSKEASAQSAAKVPTARKRRNQSMKADKAPPKQKPHGTRAKSQYIKRRRMQTRQLYYVDNDTSHPSKSQVQEKTAAHSKEKTAAHSRQPTVPNSST